MKDKIKGFINKNKEVLVGITCLLIGGAIGYTFKKDNIYTPESEKGILINLGESSVINTFDEAVEQFKDYQETNKTVAMFWEGEEYSVIDLEKK